jgi:hypothetical protein
MDAGRSRLTLEPSSGGWVMLKCSAESENHFKIAARDEAALVGEGARGIPAAAAQVPRGFARRVGVATSGFSGHECRG